MTFSHTPLALVRGALIVLAATVGEAWAADAESPVDLDFERDIQPILEYNCFGCHADGANEGSLSFDELLTVKESEHANETWYRVLKQLQAGRMPPADEEQPSPEERASLVRWIKYVAFGLNPDNPDPGRVTVRRLNQVEYRNTIRDLLGVDFDTSANFPADDTGHGFDNIGDVLSISPLLLEKYVNAAEEIVSSVVPTVPGVIRVRSVPGGQFEIDVKRTEEPGESTDGESEESGRRSRGGRGMGDPGEAVLSYYENAAAKATLTADYDGDYLVRLNIRASESYVENQFDLNKCRLTLTLRDEVLLSKEFVRQGGKDFNFEFDVSLAKGDHEFVAEVEPLSAEPQIRNLRIQIESVDLAGPKDERFFVKPEGYDQFFPRPVPDSQAQRHEYATELLRNFASRAFRRPVIDENVDRLVDLAESVYLEGGDTFESGIAKSMTAILASPRFLFREEPPLPGRSEPYPLIDEYALASRLSYFLWSSMPDAELMRLAGEGKLRVKLDEQVARMLRDDKARALPENFVGQWLRSRVIDTIQINAPAVLAREPNEIDPDGDVTRKRFFELFRKGDRRTAEEEEEFAEERVAFERSFGRGPRFELSDDLRLAMRQETEMHFGHIVRHDLSLLEMIDSDFAFLNEDLWAHYQIEGVEQLSGDEMRLVKLPAGSVRGGVLTQGSFLAVTSNPDRTSPVKRGLFILENLLGSPPPAPPPNIPALEDVEADSAEKLSLRETLAIHRENVLCASCHDRMDPLGLALENFNALGRHRVAEFGQPIDAAGRLESGEKFSTISELKRILVTGHATDIYRCMTDKMMTYALGRAVEYSDAHAVDKLVEELEATDGRASSLIYGIIHSNAFQRTRDPERLVANH